MARRGAPPSLRLATMAAMVISYSALWQGTILLLCSIAAQAFIPPVGPICRQRRIVFSPDAFLVMQSVTSSNDGTEEATTATRPPPLAFLDEKYADLFRVKKEPTSVWGSILGRLHKHKPAAKGGVNKHDHTTTPTPPHLSSSRLRSPPILRLDPETGRYVVQKPTPLVSTTHNVPEQPSNAAHAQVDGGQALVSSVPAVAAATALKKNITHDHVLTHSTTLGNEAAEEAVTSATVSITHHEASRSPSPPSSATIHADEANEGSHKHQLTADLLDVVGKAFAGSSTGDDDRIATTTVDMNTLTEADNKSSKVQVDIHADTESTDTEIEYHHQPTIVTAPDLIPPDNEDGVSNLSDASPVVDNDDKSSDDVKISTKTLATTAESDANDKALRIDSPTHVEVDATMVSNDLSQSLEQQQHPITLSEQGVRVVKSAAEAATKIAFFVGKAALTLAVAVAKAALALDEERNVAKPDELDKDSAEARAMAENALHHSPHQGKNALFGSQRSTCDETKRTKDFFFGLFGWFNIAKLAERSAPTAQDVPISTKNMAPHPPSPPSTLAALQSLEARVMELELSEKARTRHITSIDINSAIKKARSAADKASLEAEKLEAMLLGLGQ